MDRFQDGNARLTFTQSSRQYESSPASNTGPRLVPDEWSASLLDEIRPRHSRPPVGLDTPHMIACGSEEPALGGTCRRPVFPRQNPPPRLNNTSVLGGTTHDGEHDAPTTQLCHSPTDTLR
eukprot:COSAG01_NODE_4725_length_4789_cov_23.581237_2_plen_121_part_00